MNLTVPNPSHSRLSFYLFIGRQFSDLNTLLLINDIFYILSFYLFLHCLSCVCQLFIKDHDDDDDEQNSTLVHQLLSFSVNVLSVIWIFSHS